MPNITIAAITLADWQGGADVTLRVYVNQDFTAQSGAFHPCSARKNPASLGTFYKSVECTVAGGNLQVPQVVLDSTLDSPDNPDATYTAELVDEASGLAVQGFGTFNRFSLPADPVNTTWAAIFTTEANN